MIVPLKAWLMLTLLMHTVRAQGCMMNTCRNGGTCMDVTGNFMCTCTADWTGERCDVPLYPCESGPCTNGGTCIPGLSSYTCMCTAGFDGPTCQNDRCVPNPCKNGGMCMRDTSGNRYECICTEGYIGTDCETPVDSCSSNPCENGATCQPQSGNAYNCMCAAGFSGTTCQGDRCVPSPCKNGGTCMRDTSGNRYECICTQGYVGTDCEFPDPCDPNPCDNGGMCMQESMGDSSCQCPAGFMGNVCQDPATGPGGMDSTTVIIIVVAVVVVILLVVLAVLIVYYVKRSRRRVKRRASAERGNGQELRRTVGSNNYAYNSGEASSAGASGTAGGSREFPRDKIHLFGQVGSGSFAVVYKAAAEGIIQKGTTTTVAVKMLKDSATPNDKSDFKKELHLYSMLDPHPNVLSMLGCCTDKDPWYIILEYVPHGNLQSYLRHIRTGTEPTYMNKKEFEKDNLSPSEILNFACQVVRGMEYLASKQCIHRDLATRNILLGEGLICKVADFGLARDMAEKNQYEMQSQGRVPVRWMAPESLLSNIYTCKSDVWSFGVLLWELVTLGSHPYPGMSSQKVINELRKGYRLPKPDHCSEGMYKIMTDCWQEKPDDRPDFERLHIRLDDLLADATGYLEMASLNQDDYMYLEPGQPSSTEST